MYSTQPAGADVANQCAGPAIHGVDAEELELPAAADTRQAEAAPAGHCGRLPPQLAELGVVFGVPFEVGGAPSEQPGEAEQLRGPRCIIGRDCLLRVRCRIPGIRQ